MKTYVEKRINKNHKSINDYFKMYLQDLFVICFNKGMHGKTDWILLVVTDIDSAPEKLFSC